PRQDLFLAVPFETVRPTATPRSVPASCGFLSGGQEARQDLRGLLPLARFFVQLFAPGAREFVIFGFAVVVGGAPLGGNVALLLQLQQGGVERAVVHGQQVAAGLFDPARNPVPVQWPQRLSGLQHHQRQRALPNIRSFTHRFSPVAYMGYPYLYATVPMGMQ